MHDTPEEFNEILKERHHDTPSGNMPEIHSGDFCIMRSGVIGMYILRNNVKYMNFGDRVYNFHDKMLADANQEHMSTCKDIFDGKIKSEFNITAIVTRSNPDYNQVLKAWINNHYITDINSINLNWIDN